MIEIITNIIQTTLESFDFAYCISVNVLTYIIIRLISERNGHKDLTTWSKRKILIIVTITTGIAYYFCNVDYRILLNSSILAPVFWSWIMKPICQRFNVDYRQINIFD